MVGRLTDERGAIAVQMALILPIMVIIMIGAFEVWKVLYMQQVLNDAAYEGVRLLAMQPEHPGARIRAIRLVERYVARAPFVPEEVREAPHMLDVVTLPGSDDDIPAYCGDPVAIDITMDWFVGLGVVSPGTRSEWMSFLGRMAVIRGHAEGVVICERESDLEEP